MIVYHSSYTIITEIKLEYSRNNTDFSKGFYLTSIYSQAEKWAKKSLGRYNKSFVNVYELNESKLSMFKILSFKTYDKKWLDYISLCRKGLDDSDYDVVIGPIADDKVYDTINLYLEGLIDEKETLKRLKNKETNNQICIRNKKAIDELLEFIKGEKYNG